LIAGPSAANPAGAPSIPHKSSFAVNFFILVSFEFLKYDLQMMLSLTSGRPKSNI
jgi:hypothetical protein